MNLHRTNSTNANIKTNAYVPKYRFGLWDAAVILLVIFAAAGVGLGLVQTARNSVTAGSHLEAVLTLSGEEVWRTDLSNITESETYGVEIDAGHLTVLAEPGRACVSESDCSDQICVRSGWLTATGQSAVCLPYRAVLKIVSVNSQGSVVEDTNASYDAISK